MSRYSRGQAVRGWLARCLAVLVAPVLVLGVMAAMAPAWAASSSPRGSAGRSVADAAAVAAVPASLGAAIGKSLGAPVPAAGYSQTGELTIADGRAGDQFGDSVAVSAAGTTALVGVPGQELDGGAAYVFTLRDGTWSQTGELNAADGGPLDDFGTSVALSAAGTTALVGAPQPSTAAGQVYVFTLRNGTWSQAAELTDPGGELANDVFGEGVALSAAGTTALVGAPGTKSHTGAAYVFTARGGTWSQAAELTAADGAPLDSLGRSVALSASGAIALIGASVHNSDAGAAYVFRLRGGSWSQAAELTAADAPPDNVFGWSVALSAAGTTALIGALGGAAYVFTARGGTWSQAAELTASDASPDNVFGYSVALSAVGTTALIGANGLKPSAGAAYVFTRRGGTWSQAAELTASDAAPGDGFGSAAALSAAGTTALIGARGRNSDTGAVYVFTARGGGA